MFQGGGAGEIVFEEGCGDGEEKRVVGSLWVVLCFNAHAYYNAQIEMQCSIFNVGPVQLTHSIKSF